MKAIGVEWTTLVMLPAFSPLAAVDFRSPLLWGLVIGWIMTVILHEFAHGVVAYWGGDYTIRERGGLTLNPFQYVDPVMSIALPALFLLIGGIPLPGGMTYVNHSLLRNRWWETAVSLAGPGMNGLILLLLCGLTHPVFGLFDLSRPVEEWSTAQLFMGALAATQALAIVLNVIPWPPLDGFNALAPFLPPEFVARVSTPPLSFICVVVYFLFVVNLPFVAPLTIRLLDLAFMVTGGSPETALDFRMAFGMALGN